jgi:site-specific DNA recombinase
MSIDSLLSDVRSLQLTKHQLVQASNKALGKDHCVGYIRVSTKKQVDEGSSLTQQENSITDYCKSKNLSLDKIYRDDGISGGDRDRPGLNDMLDHLIAGNRVVTVSIDRIARNSEHLLNIKNVIHDKCCTMIILDRSIDTANNDSNFLIGILASIAEAERLNTRAKISSVMLDMSRRGKLRGKPRYGYKVVDKKLVEDEEEQKVISILRAFIEKDPTITPTEIAKRLTVEGIVLRKSAKIYPCAISNIIAANFLR